MPTLFQWGMTLPVTDSFRTTRKTICGGHLALIKYKIKKPQYLRFLAVKLGEKSIYFSAWKEHLPWVSLIKALSYLWMSTPKKIHFKIECLLGPWTNDQMYILENSYSHWPLLKTDGLVPSPLDILSVFVTKEEPLTQNMHIGRSMTKSSVCLFVSLFLSPTPTSLQT